MTSADPSRRTVLRSAGTAGAVAATALAVSACGGTDDAASPGGSVGATGSGTGGAGAGATTTGGTGGDNAAVLAKTADIPVGGGIIVTREKLVITQPTEGEFKGFSTTCTHQGCPVTTVKDGFIECPCHNSRFAVATGEPTPDSPAKAPLGAETVAVSGTDIVRG